MIDKHSTLSFKRYFFIYASFAIACVSSCLADLAPISYKQVAHYYLPSFGVIDGSDADAWSTSDYGRRAIAFSMFNDLYQKTSPQTQYVDSSCLHALLQDLHVFCGQSSAPTQHLFSKINRTKTVFGEAALAHMLANPLQSDESQARQDFVKELVADPALYARTSDLLEHLRSIEPIIAPLWKNKKSITQGWGDQFYIQLNDLKKYNKNAYVLEMFNRFWPLYDLAEIACSKELIATVVLWLCDREQKKKVTMINMIFPWDTNINPQKIPSPFSTFLKKIKESYWPASIGDTNELTVRYGGNYIEGNNSEWVMKFFIVLQMIDFYFKKGRQVKGVYQHEIARKHFLLLLQQSLIGVKELFTIFKQAEQELTANAPLHALIDPSNQVSNLLNTQPSPALQELKKLLETNTFEKKGISFFPPHMGRILVAYKYLNSARHEFIGPLHVLAQLDAYFSIATLYKEFESKPVRYSFVEYCKQSTPFIDFKQFWNPFIDYNVVVPNDFSLGKPNSARTIILTGSNTGGKSTQMNGALLNILLAQTIGIAAGESITLTPFGYLGISRNITDDQNRGISSFDAEVRRAKTLVEATQKFNPNSFGFTIIDEPFKGTTPKSNAKACLIFTKKLMPSPYGLFVLATHSDQFIADALILETETNGLLSLYKIDVIKQPDGTLKHTYKLEPGASTSNIAEEILNAQFDAIGSDFLN